MELMIEKLDNIEAPLAPAPTDSIEGDLAAGFIVGLLMAAIFAFT